MAAGAGAIGSRSRFPARRRSLSYEFPAVLPLKDGTWLSVLTERRLKKRPQLPLDIPQTLVRSYSTDQGRSWTEPEPLCVGSWASLTPMGNGTVACSFALWSAWGSMEVMFSGDGFRTIRHRTPFVEHNWLPGYGPSGWGGGWARDPIPLPPVVAQPGRGLEGRPLRLSLPAWRWTTTV